MLTLNISKTDIEVLRYERYAYPSIIVQKRLHALYLKATTNLGHQAIAGIVGIHRDTLTNYIHRYNAGGLPEIYRVDYGTNCSELDAHKESLLEYFEQHPPQSSTEALSEIKRLTGLERSPTQVRKWFHKHGLKPIKAGQIPSKADSEKQATFINKALEPLIEKTENEEIHLLFMDAAHFVMGVFLPVLWSIKRVFVKSSSGRKRYNVLGAVNAINQKVHLYINAQTIITRILYR